MRLSMWMFKDLPKGKQAFFQQWLGTDQKVRLEQSDSHYILMAVMTAGMMYIAEFVCHEAAVAFCKNFELRIEE